ncbi:MAG: (Fe-S)-binding protein [Chloroflexi bacterium]|nr:(Fe-S)-binding protein [Chloroflexota bacterium]
MTATFKAQNGFGYPDSLRCLRCGLCLAVCPTYRERGLEPASPRGRVALAQAFAEGRLKATAGLEEHLAACLDCLACTAMCPAGVRIDALVQESRGALAQRRGLPFLKRVALKQVLPHPWRRGVAAQAVRLYRRLGILAQTRTLGLKRWQPTWDIAHGLLASVPLDGARPRLEGTHPAQGEAKGRVGFFLGCLQGLAFPQVAQASVALLQRQGYEVVVPPGLTCCGKPLAAHGDLAGAREQARKNLRAFASAGVEAIVTDCATCGDFLQGYGRLLEGDEMAGEAREFSGQVQDISCLLSCSPGPARDGGKPLRVTYHDPCHLARGQGLREEPRRLLRSIPGLELVEMAESDGCCGGAGTYNLEHPELSLGILKRKMENIAATGAAVVASGCPGCLLQLRLGAQRHGLALRVAHPVELIEESLAASSSS